MTSQDRDLTSATFYILAAHGGAGYHPPASDPSLKSSLCEAISSAFSGTTTTSDTISSGPSALDAATRLIAVLEDAPDLNAGYGSNLTYDGDVECDASLMSIDEENSRDATTPDSNSSPPSSPLPYSFGSVGAVRGMRNPVLLARRVLEGRRETTIGSGSGRVPPLMLVGEGAAQFAREQGLRVVDRRDRDRFEEEMVAPRARREWRKWRDVVDAESRSVSGSGSLRQEGGEEADEVVVVPADGGGDVPLGVAPLHARQDTVGAVVLVGGMDNVRQQIAAGVSSGGLLLKHSGRIGEAAMFGAGCWVERTAGGRSVACSVSGQGELIMQSNLARALAERTVASTADDTHEILRSVLVDDFYRKWHQRGESQLAVGVLLLTQGMDMDGNEGAARLWCAFTTQSMAVAYASSRHPKPKATVLWNTTHDFSKDDDGRPPLFITTFPC